MLKKKPNLLLTCKYRVRGGGQEKNFLQIACHLKDQYNFTFLTAGGYIEDEIRSIGNVYTFPGKGKWIFAPVDLLYFIYIALKENIDLVHAHHRYAAFLGSITRKLLGIKLITTVHNVFPDKSNISLFGDHIIAVSHAVKHWLIKECKVPEKIITVIHNGIATPRQWTTDELHTLKTQLIPNNTVHTLLTIGRLLPQKNYTLLLNSLSKLKNRNWHLLIIGEGDEENSLKKLTHSLELDRNVSFLGFRTDVEGLLQISDLYVMSSRWEGLPYVLVEALANSLPAVATKVGGVNEAVLNGKTGLVIPADNEEVLTQSVEGLLLDQERLSNMAIECKKHFSSNFLDSEMIDKITTCYQVLLNK